MVLKNADSDFSPRISPKNWLLPVLNNTNTPPLAPNDGDRYRVTAVATGAWTGQENTIAVWEGEALTWRFFTLVEPQIWYDMTSQNWHYMSHAGVITQFDKIPLAISDVTGLQAALDGKAPLVHKANHVVGGTDPFIAGDLLDATAKHNILNNGALVATRRGLNLIPGANISFAAVDNAVSERVDVTITAAVGGAHALLDGVTDNDTVATAVLRGMLIVGNATPKWSGLALAAANLYLKSNGTDLVYSAIAESDVTSLVADLASKQPNLGYTAENLANKGVANGYCDLDGSDLVPASRLVGRCTQIIGGADISMGSNSYSGVGQVVYHSIMCFDSSKVQTVEANGSQAAFPRAGTLKNMYVKVRTNASTAVINITVRKNGVNTTLVVAVGAGVTGILTDLVHTVAVAAGDLLDIQVDSATTGNIFVDSLMMEFDS